MIIEIKKQETTVTEIPIQVELPYYFMTNRSVYSKECFAVMEDLTMLKIYIGDHYRSVSSEPGSIEQIQKMLNDAETKYENRKQITKEEFESLLHEFYQTVIPNNNTNQ